MTALVLINRDSRCFVDQHGSLRAMNSRTPPHIFTSDNIYLSIGEDWEAISLEEFISLKFVVKCMEM